MFKPAYLGRRHFLAAASMGLTAGSFSPGRSQSLPNQGELPSFTGATEWLNSPALTSSELRGKVVVVNFWTYTCINWLRSFPDVRAWSEQYGGPKLAVVGVHTPEFEFEKEIGNVRRAATRYGVNYPIAVDSGYAVWRAFDNHYWPALYVADAKGRIRHHQFGESGHEETESVIRRLLGEANAPSLDKDLAHVKASGVEAAADWASLRSPENYLSSDRTKGFTSSAAKMNKPRAYAASKKLKLNQWGLAGNWTFRNNSIVANQDGSRIAYRFHARDVHLVMGASAGGTGVRFRVLLNGQAPGSSHGIDVDEQGSGNLVEPRLYQLIRQSAAIADRQIEIEFGGGGAEAFAFTLG